MESESRSSRGAGTGRDPSPSLQTRSSVRDPRREQRGEGTTHRNRPGEVKSQSQRVTNLRVSSLLEVEILLGCRKEP